MYTHSTNRKTYLSNAPTFPSTIFTLSGPYETVFPPAKLSYLDKELAKGDAIELYFVRAGGIRTAGKWDWMLLVKESSCLEDPR
jgi:hypothetical protein